MISSNQIFHFIAVFSYECFLQLARSDRVLMICAYLIGQDLYKYLIIYINEYLKTLQKVHP